MATPRLTLLKPAHYKRMPWKNGLGWTDQIAISPDNADLRRADYDWRLSTAHVAQSADFSPFPEHDRVLTIVSGAGVRLSHRFEEAEEPEHIELPLLEPYEFPGDVPTRCDLVDGPIQDLSVFIRKGIVSAVVDAIELSEGEPFEWELQGQVGFVFVVPGGEGSAQVMAGSTRLGPGETLRIDRADASDESAIPLSSPGARVVLVQLARS